MTRKYLYGHELPTEQRDKFRYLSDEDFIGNYFFLYGGRYFDFHDVGTILSYFAYDYWLQVDDEIEADLKGAVMRPSVVAQLFFTKIPKGL